MAQIVQGECANGGVGGGACPPETQGFPLRRRVPAVHCCSIHIHFLVVSSDSVLHPRSQAPDHHYCRGEAFATGWDRTVRPRPRVPPTPPSHHLPVPGRVSRLSAMPSPRPRLTFENSALAIVILLISCYGITITCLQHNLLWHYYNDCCPKGAEDIVIMSAGLHGWCPRYGFMKRILMAISLSMLLLPPVYSYIQDLLWRSTILIVQSGYRYMNRKIATVVSLLGLLLLALVFVGIHMPSDNSLALTRGSEIKMLHNHKHSHDRVLLSFSHETHGNVSKDDGTINADLTLTAENADGSGQDQKTLPHWIFNQNINQSGKHYEEKRELQKQNGQGKSHLSAHKIIKAVVVSCAVVLALVVVCYIFVLLRRKCGNRLQRNVPQVQLDLHRVSGGPRRFQFDELAAATDNFNDDNKLGQGGFGPVYRGFLRDQDRHVAIKLLSSETSWQGKKEFDAEVKVLAQLRHRNIVQLVGWCDSNEGFLLVYELMAEGSLDKHLHNPVRILSWQQRYKIILDLGSALFYLHRCCDKCIVHGDIKPENVMLDASFNAKLGDFGTARLVEHGAEPRTTEIVAGTRGYIDPEFIVNRLRCPDADVYSFGIALLEIASGKRPASRHPSEASALPLWVRHLYDRHKIIDAADEKMNGGFDRQQMEHVLVTGLWCAHQDPSQRPSIEQAMDALRCVDATLHVLPATRDAQQLRLLEELAYGDLTGGEGANTVEVDAASTLYLTSKDSAYLLHEE